MNRVRKVLIVALITALAALFALFVAAVVVTRTPWFRNLARERLIASINESTGGRTEIGEFSFSPGRLSAEITDVVLHGTEPPGAPPLFRAKRVVVDLKLWAALHRRLEVRSLAVEKPQVHITVRPGGGTNLPRPAGPEAPARKSPLQTIVKAAVGRFQAAGGLLVVNDRRIPINLRGENVRARLVYTASSPRYTGAISTVPAYVSTNGHSALPVNIDIPFEVSANDLAITNARLQAPSSHLQASARLRNLNEPRGFVRLSGRLALPELARSFKPSLLRKTQGTPPVDVNATASLEGDRAKIQSLNLVMGRSSLDASGAVASLQTFTGTFEFSGDFTMQELKNLLNLPSLGTGTVHVTGTAKTGPNGIDVKAKFSAANVALNAGPARLEGVNISSDVRVVSGNVSLANLRIAALGGEFNGSAEIANRQRFVVDGVLTGVDLRQAAAAYGTAQFAWSGAVSGPVHIEGSLSGPIASQLVAAANLGIVPQGGGIPLSGRLDFAYNGPNNAISFGNSFLELPSSRMEFSGATGARLSIRAASRNLNDLLPVLALATKTPPRALPVELVNGEATFEGTVTGSIADPRIEGSVTASNFVVNRQKFDRFAANIAIASNGASVGGGVLTQRQFEANFDGSAGLVNWRPQPSSPVRGNISLRNARVETLLAAAGWPALPVAGELFADANLSGTVGDPQAAVALTLKNGAAYGESFELVQARAAYSNSALRLTSAEITGPYGRLQASAGFQHPPGDFSTGRIEFRAETRGLELSGIRAVSARQPGLSGIIEFSMDGAGTLPPPSAPLPFLLTRLNARLAAPLLTINREPAGGFMLTAQTRGSNLVFALRSGIAGSDISGSGTWQLSGDYPIQLRARFSPVQIGEVARLVSPSGFAQNLSGVIAGSFALSGPVFRPADLNGTLQFSQVELGPREQRPGRARPFILRNAGPVVASLSQSALRLQRARLVGPSTDISVAGAMFPAKGNALDFRAFGRIGLEFAGSFYPDVSSSGAVLLSAAVQGTLARPDVNGRLELRNASLNVVDFPNGISNANGVVLFSGTQAVIQKIAGEMGGGKVGIDGIIHYGGPVVDFRLQAAGDGVRIDYPEKISTKINAKLALAGTTASSLLSGDVSVLEMFLRTDTDIGALLAPGGPPRVAPAARTGLLGGMRIDVRIATAPDVQYYSALARNLQADGSLQLRGAPTQPGMLGRIDVTEGEILFFGYRYIINRGTISFYNPQRIEPILDVSLETKAKGITVTVLVSGPADRLKLTYSSDPPLLFSDIVALLTTGRAPTSDPVLAARLPAAPEQSLQQLGASALLGQAIANPVAGRLQRLFGISQLTINPQLVGSENTPQTQITLQQQITRNFSFTYIQTLTEANPQTIRAEWAIDPNWSAVAARDQEGRFAIDLYYKRTFR